MAKLQSEKVELEQTLSAVLGEAATDMASPQKQAIEKALECVVCLNVNGRVLQCPRGHLICQTCHSSLGKDKKECPVCRVAYPSEHIRNLLATAVNILSHAPSNISSVANVSHCSLLGISHFLHQLCLRAMTSSSSRLHQVSEND